MASVPAAAQKVNATVVAAPFRSEIQQKISSLSVTPLLVGFLGTLTPRKHTHDKYHLSYSSRQVRPHAGQPQTHLPSRASRSALRCCSMAQNAAQSCSDKCSSTRRRMYNHRVHGQTPTRSMLASFAEPIMLASNTSSHCVDRTRPSLSARCHKPSNICATTKWQERRRHNRCHELPPAPPSPPVPKLSYPNHLNLAPHDLTGIFARPANGDAAARKYAEWTRKACEADGIQFELRECDKVELPQRLAEANEDPAVHGIMIYYPCFGAVPSFDGRSMDDSLRDAVAVEKDVEGLCHTYRRALFHDERFLRYLDGTTSERKCVLPCTPLAIVKILEHLKVYDEQLPVGGRMSGKIVTVINRSEIVGRPVAAMLANDGADVYSVDIDSIYLMRKGQMIATELTPEEVCKKSQVIITGVPVKSYQLPTEWVQPNTCVVNVSNFKNVDEEALLQVPGVNYVPLVGKVTVAMLERNLIRLVENYHDPNAVEKVKVIEAGGRLVKL